MRKLYQIIAEASKDVPVIIAQTNFVVKRGEKVTFTFKGTGFATKAVNPNDGYERYTDKAVFRNNELVNIHADVVDVDDSLYLHCKESTDHRFSMSKEEADERINLSVPNYFRKD